MLTDLEWRYAKHERDFQEENWRWEIHSVRVDASSHMVLAFEDMEQRQFEQDWYDNFENELPKSAFEHHQHHHELPEPVPQHQLDVERIIELLGNGDA